MSNKSVVVLVPNGRRQSIKVTPNTTILQVLEEVCKKQGMRASDYDVVHHKKVLDPSSSMRYTGLPNNAQLELIAALNVRTETCVKVCLALESGKRVIGEFQPAESLWHVVETLCPEETNEDFDNGVLPVVFYVGREECGIENLKSTTLRSLGLTAGSAVLRFFKKSEAQLHQQANVSAPLCRPAPSQDLQVKSSSILEVQESEALRSESEILPTADLKNDEKVEMAKCLHTPSLPSPKDTGNLDFFPPVVDKRPENENMDIVSEDNLQTIDSSIQSSLGAPCTFQKPSEEPEPESESGYKPEETIVFLGERNAVLFDLASAEVCKAEEIPDDFFELTVDDAKQLLRDMKRRQAALEEQPLVTAQFRELEKSKHMLNTLHRYRRCIIRVHFPNQLVLQGTFTPLEKVSSVMDFVRGYLHDPSIEFVVFTAPPKRILKPDLSLYDANCVPGASVYFTSPIPCPASGSYIREDIMAQVSSASGASATAAMTLGFKVGPQQVGGSQSSPTSDSLPGAASVSNEAKSSRVQSTDGSKKVPKWFKVGPK